MFSSRLIVVIYALVHVCHYFCFNESKFASRTPSYYATAQFMLHMTSSAKYSENKFGLLSGFIRANIYSVRMSIKVSQLFCYVSCPLLFSSALSSC